MRVTIPRNVTFALFAVLGLAGATVMAAPEAAPTVTAGASFAVDQDLRIVAGSQIDIPVTAADATGTSPVAIISAAGTSVVDVAVSEGRGVLTLGPPHTIRSGVVTVSLPGSETITVEIQPSDDGEQLDINVGPTSVRNGKSTMAVGLLTDVWGNPVTDGTPISMTIADTDDEVTTFELETMSGLAVVDLPTETFTNDFTIALSTDALFTPAIPVHVQANEPTAFGLEVGADVDLEADGRTLVTIRSDELADREGRRIPDGAHVVLDMVGQNGPATAIGEVVDGEVKASIIAPSQPGSLTITATVNGTTSSPLTVDFAAAVEAFPVSFDVIDGERWLRIGPVVGPDGGLLPDGTEVQIGTDRRYLVDGQVSHPLGSGETIPVVTILGVTGVVS